MAAVSSGYNAPVEILKLNFADKTHDYFTIAVKKQ